MRIAIEARLPQRFADDRDRRRRAFSSASTSGRPSSGDAGTSRNARGGDADAVRRLGAAIFGFHIAGDVLPGAEALDERQLLAPGAKVVQVAALEGVLLEVAGDDADQPIAAGERQRRPDHAVDELEIGRARAKGDCQRDDRDHRQARRLDEHPHAERQVHRPAGEAAERARVTLQLFGLFDAAERAPRRETRVFTAHALGDEVVFEQLQMAANLAREVRLGLAGTEQRQKPADGAAHFDEHCCSTWTSSGRKKFAAD